MPAPGKSHYIAKSEKLHAKLESSVDPEERARLQIEINENIRLLNNAPNDCNDGATLVLPSAKPPVVKK